MIRKKRSAKYGIVLILLVGMVLMMTACTKEEPKEWSSFTQPLAEALLEDVKFSQELAPVDMNLLTPMYGVEEAMLQDYAVYMSSGGTADEFAIFFAKDTETAKEITKFVEMRVEDQKSVMENYLPEEMSKLENAVIKSEGPYVILCVTDDAETAKDIIHGYFQ